MYKTYRPTSLFSKNNTRPSYTTPFNSIAQEWNPTDTENIRITKFLFKCDPHDSNKLLWHNRKTSSNYSIFIEFTDGDVSSDYYSCVKLPLDWFSTKFLNTYLEGELFQGDIKDIINYWVDFMDKYYIIPKHSNNMSSVKYGLEDLNYSFKNIFPYYMGYTIDNLFEMFTGDHNKPTTPDTAIYMDSFRERLQNYHEVISNFQFKIIVINHSPIY